MIDLFLEKIPDLMILSAGAYIFILSLLRDIVPGKERGRAMTTPMFFSPETFKNNCCAMDCYALDLPFKVLLEDQTAVTAYVGTCSLCMGKITKGDMVSIDRTGHHLRAKKISSGKKS
ncbi:hypothetical protein [Desulfobacula phenolica]|uniref:Uncharacterized protein n=1 Tax=Desulfobacula phenolica TaxID=90732 RepID=A0A1H2DNF8_9BACT|nr:hypothetical protein [Desulfobacula phenolica]SDT84271.1 hypothetical protein SAMN04487931_101184 [Desulfobacula phenolica]